MVEARWADLRAEPGTLTLPEAQVLAGTGYSGSMDRFGEKAGSQASRRPELYERLRSPSLGTDPKKPSNQGQDAFALDFDQTRASEMDVWCETYADKLLGDRSFGASHHREGD